MGAPDTPSERVLIAGGPRTGKTTLARRLASARGLAALHTDDLIGTCDWSEASSRVATWLDQPGPWIIEGVAVARALRKWLAMHPDGSRPADVVCLLEIRLEPLSGRQAGMAAGCETVWMEIVPTIVSRGVRVLGAHQILDLLRP